MTLIDQPDQPLIGRLSYFEVVLGEIREHPVPDRNCQRLGFNLVRREACWRARSAKGAGRARPTSAKVRGRT